MATSNSFYCPYSAGNGGSCVQTQGLECKADSDCAAGTSCMQVPVWGTWDSCTWGSGQQDPLQFADCSGGLGQVPKKGNYANLTPKSAMPTDSGSYPPTGTMGLCVINKF